MLVVVSISHRVSCCFKDGNGHGGVFSEGSRHSSFSGFDTLVEIVFDIAEVILALFLSLFLANITADF